MMQSVKREILIPRRPEKVWAAIANSASLEQWMYPNDFQPIVGHQFTFRIPGNPKVNFEGMTIDCKVVTCEPPRELVFTWSAGNELGETQVSFQLEPDVGGTRLLFEHSGFDVSLPRGKQAYGGAKYGWAKMLDQLVALLADSAA